MSETRVKRVSRREALGVIGAAGAAMVACNSSTPTSPTTVTPSETAGPFPSITLPVRSDVREDRTGLPLNLAITVVNASANCVPVTNASGVARFTTIYPGWYAGRATHIHIEVFVNNRSVKTSQIAFPEEINSAVYATGVYASKGQNPTKNDRDGIFSDGFTSELATLTGNTSSGYNATFQVGITV